jgi:Na+/H+ antiporter NhaD/arsenite permease-like protein
MDFCLLAAGGAGEPHPAMMLPFGLILACIALMPLIHSGWWERHYPQVALGLAAVTTTYYVFGLQDPGRMLHVAHEYLSFMALIGSLFVVAGGIHIRVTGEATPRVNCIFLALGAALANVVGTTGASMLLIRPWIRMNKYRVTAFHIVFFIFLVSNVGGCLTPVGDPPLFLGYLKGVPFWWGLEHCWSAWVVVVGTLVGIFYVIDRRNFLRAPAPVRAKETSREIWRVDGKRNLFFLAVILAAVFVESPIGLREILMAGAAVASYYLTPAPLHAANDFHFGPIREVAWLFAGIFATMVPALDYVQRHAHGLGLDSPLRLYWSTGVVSAVLDNAPTYLSFLAAELGQQQLRLDVVADVQALAAQHTRELMAISLGAVFFGAMTYIGNGPNFMVKSIAEQAKIRVPSFVGYCLRFALPILLPVLAAASLLFFSRWAVE